MHLTTLTLDLRLHPGDLPGFRACIAELAGHEHELFHNHDNSDPEAAERYHWDYPLVQYAVRRGLATVIGIGPGAIALEQQLLPKFMLGAQEELFFAGRANPVHGYRLERSRWEPELLAEPREYELAGWLALNKENYGTWKAASGEGMRRALLDSALTGHLRCMADGLDLADLKPFISAQIQAVTNQKRVQWHGAQLVRFNVRFATRLLLPAGIGIGRCAAFGFGELRAAKSAVSQRRRMVVAALENI